MGKAVNKKPGNISDHLYGRVCGRELGANLLHFQFLPAFYARRDIRRDGPALTGRLLDLGCGNQPYRPFLPPEVEYIGLDYPPTRAAFNPKVRPEVYGDARTLPFADQSFDAALCFQVLEHVDRPEAVVREIQRVLKPGGLGFISAPFCYNLHMEPHDFFRFSPYGLKDLLEKNGLGVRQLRGQGGIGALLVQMFHNWLFSGLSRRARGNVLIRGLLVPLLPVLLLLSALNNLAALALDRLNGDDLRFTPNLWVIAAKTVETP
jgi:SAM-dependent methyltransferase